MLWFVYGLTAPNGPALKIDEFGSKKAADDYASRLRKRNIGPDRTWFRIYVKELQ